MLCGMLTATYPMPAPQWEPSQAHGGKLGNKYAVGRGLFPCGAPWTPHNLPPQHLRAPHNLPPLHPGHSPALRRQPLRSPPRSGVSPGGEGGYFGGTGGVGCPPSCPQPGSRECGAAPPAVGIYRRAEEGAGTAALGRGDAGRGPGCGEPAAAPHPLRTRSAPAALRRGHGAAPEPLRAHQGAPPPAAGAGVAGSSPGSWAESGDSIPRGWRETWVPWGFGEGSKESRGEGT